MTKNQKQSRYIEGDGTFQKRIDEGRCPACTGSLRDNGSCSVCSLTITDMSDNISDRQEIDMIETQIEPSIEDIAAEPERMSWQDAVTIIEELVMQEESEEVTTAWHRLLQG